MTQQQLLRLLSKYLEGNASRAEEELLLRYYNDCQLEESWDEAELGDPGKMEQDLLERLQQRIRTAPVVPLYRRPLFRVAAAAILLIAACMAYWWQPGSLPVTGVVQTKLPSFKHVATSQVTLTLADGSVQVLADTASGIIALDNGFRITKQGRILLYEDQGGVVAHAAVAYHLLALPAGKQYQLVLPDGSKVWLNATSVLRFPLRFTPTRRLVEIQGEAYFEVARDEKRVFQVRPVGADGKSRGTLVEVLGTHFNVEAYKEEKAIRTTLLEGKVKVSVAARKDAATVLAPGEQALAAEATPIKVATVDVDRVVAWQRGLFDFEGANTREVMRQLARWYDLQVSYGNLDESLRFSGKISRGMALEDVLRILEQSGLRFAVQGRRVRVGA